ncbi:MAG: BspA family leucine-rich repeat surface protein, partial [Bacilli bacterium]|nr:BspA family leucine-rich repeat surface protein [Bacilli bacterium]
GEIEKVVVEIDGIYCKYEKGIDTICREESFYSYMKNSNNAVEIISELENKYNVSVNCLDNGECTLEEQESMATNGNAINELIAKLDMTYYGIERENIKTIEFTNIEPEGEGVDISLNNTNDVLLYSKVTDEMYDIKIYSEKEIMFPKDSSQMFMFLENLDELVLENINTSLAKNMSAMFANTGYSSEVFMLDLGNKFDTSKVTNMEGMFDSAGSSSKVFTLDLGDKFDTSNVTNMTYMFSGTGRSSEVFTLDLGDKFDTSQVTDMAEMFAGTGLSSEVFTLDLGDKFDTSSVVDMHGMFAYTGSNNPNFILDLSTFDTSNVTDMSMMFSNATTLKTIYVSENWTTDVVTESAGMFYDCTSLPNFNSSVDDKTNAHYNTGGYLTLKNN